MCNKESGHSVAHIKDRLHAAGRAVSDGAHQIADKVNAAGCAVRERARDARDCAADAVQDAEAVIRNNPGKAVAAAGALGLAIGFLLARKK